MQRLPAAALTAALMLVTAPGQAVPAGIETRQAALDRDADRAVAENDRAFREAEEIARRYGVDFAPFRRAHDDLRRERAESLRKGDRLNARMVEALLARNTFNALNNTLGYLPEGPERRQHIRRVDAARTVADAAAPAGR